MLAFLSKGTLFARNGSLRCCVFPCSQKAPRVHVGLGALLGRRFTCGFGAGFSRGTGWFFRRRRFGGTGFGFGGFGGRR